MKSSSANRKNILHKSTIYYWALFLIAIMLPISSKAQIYTYISTDNPQAIPPDGSGGFNCVDGPTISEINVPISGSIGSIYTLDNVIVNITHSANMDLEITLISPMGTMWNLSNANGTFLSDNYEYTVFEDGNPSITTGISPFRGHFEAQDGPLNVGFSGESIMGNWQLSICDNGGGDEGSLLNYSIAFRKNNDTKEGSIEVDPMESCRSYDGNLNGSSPSAPQPPDCGTSLLERGDVWYSFVATSNPVTVKVVSSPGMTAAIGVFSDTDDLLLCEAGTNQGDIVSIVLTPGVTIGYNEGETYFIRTYDVSEMLTTTYFTFYLYEDECPEFVNLPNEGFHVANAEFTDESGWTHYTEQDSMNTFLLFSIHREGRNIGQIGDGLFEVVIQRDSNVYDVTSAPYANQSNVEYLASGYYWKVRPKYELGIDLLNPFTIKSYYVSEEYEAMRNSYPELGDNGHDMLTHYKIDGPLNPDPSATMHSDIPDSEIHFFENGPEVGDNFFTVESFISGSDYIGQMCIILFSGGGFLVEKSTVGVTAPTVKLSDLVLSPIPAHDVLKVTFNSNLFGEGKLLVYSSIGKRYDEKKWNYQIGNNELVLSINDLPEGLYYINFFDGDNKFLTTKKFIKLID